MEREGPSQAGLEAVTRRRLLQAAGGVALAAVAFAPSRATARAPSLSSAGVLPNGEARKFRSLPGVRPPTVTVTGSGGSAGYLMIGPQAFGHSQGGPLIVDEDGEPVWFRPLPHGYVPSN